MPCPAVVCAYRLGLSTISPIPCGAGLGFIGRKSMRCLFTNGKVWPKSEAKILFQRKLCYRTVEERIRLQEQKLGGIFPGPKRSPKPIFDCGGQACRIIWETLCY